MIFSKQVLIKEDNCCWTSCKFISEGPTKNVNLFYWLYISIRLMLYIICKQMSSLEIWIHKISKAASLSSMVPKQKEAFRKPTLKGLERRKILYDIRTASPTKKLSDTSDSLLHRLLTGLSLFFFSWQIDWGPWVPSCSLAPDFPT